jgi:hypothetical protein
VAGSGEKIDVAAAGGGEKKDVGASAAKKDAGGSTASVPFAWSTQLIMIQAGARPLISRSM